MSDTDSDPSQSTSSNDEQQPKKKRRLSLELKEEIKTKVSEGIYTLKLRGDIDDERMRKKKKNDSKVWKYIAHIFDDNKDMIK